MSDKEITDLKIEISSKIKELNRAIDKMPSGFKKAAIRALVNGFIRSSLFFIKRMERLALETGGADE